MKSPNKLIELLSNNSFEFVIIGGFAGVLHGSAYVTHDLDLCVLFSKHHVERLREILRPYRPVHRMTPARLSFLEVPLDCSGLNNLYLDTDLGQLDLLSEVKGVGSYEEVAKDAITIELFGKKCKVMSIDCLIRSKLKMGREKDKAMVKELRVIKEKKGS